MPDSYTYAWLIWSLLLLGIWVAIYATLDSKEKRREMFIVSLWTSLLGFTEPIFVPEYWSPLSLFDLAFRTGFDIESIIFAFAIGGGASVVYERIFTTRHEKMPTSALHEHRHRYHRLAIVSAPIVFALLYFATSLNPIYSASIALFAGGIFSLYCRPDLLKKMIVSACIFLVLYFTYFMTLIALYPGYVERVWNLEAVSGILVIGVPIEELLFAASFGFLWSSMYEHFTWRILKTV